MSLKAKMRSDQWYYPDKSSGSKYIQGESVSADVELNRRQSFKT